MHSRVYAVLVAAILACAGQSAVAQRGTSQPLQLVPKSRPARVVRLPRSRPPVIPQQLAPPQEDYASLPQPQKGGPLQPPSACDAQLAAVARFQRLGRLIGPGECGAADAVKLESVTLPDGRQVAISPPATLRCSMAQAIANWVRTDIAPSVQKLGAPLRGLDNFDSYECRGRNRVRGAKLSEHGRANALDVRSFRLANGQAVGLTDVKVPRDFRDAIRASACARFATVLGPGSDGSHEQHIHVDLAERHNNYKVCEWDIRGAVPAIQAAAPAAAASLNGVPLPRPRPATAKRARLRGMN